MPKLNGPTFPFSILPPMNAATPTSKTRMPAMMNVLLFCIFAPKLLLGMLISGLLDELRIAIEQDIGNDPISAPAAPNRNKCLIVEISQISFFCGLLHAMDLAVNR